MKGYKLSIKNSAGDEISLSTAVEKGQANELGSPDITEARFKMNTLDNSVVARASSVRAELMISGNITENNKEKILKLALWATDDNPKTIYRSVELIVYSDQYCQGEVLRTYNISNMFVVDYTEEFTNIDSGHVKDADLGAFKLFIVQRDGNTQKKISAY